MRPTALVPVCAAVMAALWLATCGSSGSTAGSVAERLVDAMGFENGEIVSETPPVGNEGSDYPQVTGVTATDELRLGAPFSVTVGIDFATPAEVGFAIVQVAGAGRFIRVAATPIETAQGWELRLFGVLAADADLRGESGRIHLSLMTADGRMGVYGIWNLTVADEPPLAGTPIDEVTLAGEEWNESGRPDGNPSADQAPQIDGASAPASVTVGQEFSVQLRSANADPTDIAAVILTTPGNEGFKRTVEFSAAPLVRATGPGFGGALVTVQLTIADERLAGLRLVLLWALENRSGQTGAYSATELPVAAASACDDADCDRQCRSDGYSGGQCGAGQECICRDEPRTEVCGDGVDNDANQLMDCDDPACFGTEACPGTCSESSACPPGQECDPESGTCVPAGTDGDTGGCASAADCQSPGECVTMECVSRECLYENKAAGTACSLGTCDGAGTCVPARSEICGNGVDDDGNTFSDCADPACVGTPSCQGGCTSDSDCTAGQWCNPETSTCEPQPGR